MISLNSMSPLGDTAASYINTLPYELDGDGVGFWVIVPAGRSFGFEGQDLAEFVRLCIERLIDVGGIVARFADHGPRRWVEQVGYGSTKSEIAAAIVAEWQTQGGGDPDWESLWFVTPRVLKHAAFVP
jgi:hypothetical protein